MSDSFRRFQRDFESFANQQTAEIEAVRAALQVFLARILSAGSGTRRSRSDRLEIRPGFANSYLV